MYSPCAHGTAVSQAAEIGVALERQPHVLWLVLAYMRAPVSCDWIEVRPAQPLAANLSWQLPRPTAARRPPPTPYAPSPHAPNPTHPTLAGGQQGPVCLREDGQRAARHDARHRRRHAAQAVRRPPPPRPTVMHPPHCTHALRRFAPFEELATAPHLPRLPLLPHHSPTCCPQTLDLRRCARGAAAGGRGAARRLPPRCERRAVRVSPLPRRLRRAVQAGGAVDLGAAPRRRQGPRVVDRDGRRIGWPLLLLLRHQGAPAIGPPPPPPNPPTHPPARALAVYTMAARTTPLWPPTHQACRLDSGCTFLWLHLPRRASSRCRRSRCKSRSGCRSASPPTRRRMPRAAAYRDLGLQPVDLGLQPGCTRGGLNAQSCSLKHRIGWLPGCTGPELPPPPTARHRAGGAHAAPLHEAHGEAPLQRLAAHGDALQHGARATLQAAPRRARLARAAACLAGTQPHAHAPATARTRPRLCACACATATAPRPLSRLRRSRTCLSTSASTRSCSRTSCGSPLPRCATCSPPRCPPAGRRHGSLCLHSLRLYYLLWRLPA